MRSPLQEVLGTDPLFALARPDVLHDPYPAYAWLRQTRPIFWDRRIGSWMLARHADCADVLRDHHTFVSDWRRIGEETPPQAVSIQTLDPPEHTGLRRVLLEAFAARNGAAERIVAARTAEFLPRLARRPSFDFVSGFAEPLALATVCDFLGVPVPDLGWFVSMADAISAGMDAGIWPERGGPAMMARAELAALTERWLGDASIAGPVRFIADEARGQGVPASVVANTLRVLLHAGYTSASKFLALAAVAILAEPNGWARFAAADPGRATDELARYTSPVQGVARACAVDTTLGETPIRAGQPVTLLLGAANRDPDRFTSPDELKLDRQPNPHLGFGRGAHSCLGAMLARTQARVALVILAERFPRTVALGPAFFRPNLTLRSVERFEVVLR